MLLHELVQRVVRTAIFRLCLICFPSRCLVGGEGLCRRSQNVTFFGDRLKNRTLPIFRFYDKKAEIDWTRSRRSCLKFCGKMFCERVQDQKCANSWMVIDTCLDRRVTEESSALCKFWLWSCCSVQHKMTSLGPHSHMAKYPLTAYCSSQHWHYMITQID